MTLSNPQVLRLAAVICGLGCAAEAPAYQGEVAGLGVDVANKFSIGGLWRVEDRDPALIGISNGGSAHSTNHDDGNLAYARGLVAATAKLTTDLTLTRGDYGLFLRGSYLYDPEQYRQDYFNPTHYGSGKSAPLSEYDARTRAVRDHLGNDADLLDAYLFSNLSLAGHAAAVKLGRQVVNWGESTLISNGVNGYLAADANQLRVPGFELDEVYIPYEQLFVSVSVWRSLNVEGFYQLKWRQTEPDASGAYFGSNDFIGIGGARAHIGFGQAPENTPGTSLPRAPDRTPGNGGQFGVKADYTFDALNNLNLAVYGIQYHSRLPLLSGTTKPTFSSPSETATYFQEYPEEIKLYGLSFNSTLPFGIAIQGEYSFKKDQPLQIDDVELLLYGQGVPSQLDPNLGGGIGGHYVRGWRRHAVQQVDLGFTKILAPWDTLGYDQILVLAEFGYTHANLPSTRTLRYDAPATDTPGDCTLEALACSASVPENTNSYATSGSWGYRLLARADYNGVFGSPIGLMPALVFFHDVSGTTPTPLTNFVEGRRQLGLSLGYKYMEGLSGDIGYMRNFGAGERNLLGDRDTAQLTIKYAF